MIAVSLLLATLSYVWIEQPFRTRKMRTRSALRVDLAAASTVGAMVLAGLLVAQVADVWRPYPTDVRWISSFLDYRGTPEWRLVAGPAECMIHASSEGNFARFEPETCLPEAGDEPNYLLLGDSYAGHLMHALERQMPDINLQIAGASGCRPTLEAEGTPWCEKLMRLIFDEHVPAASLDGVILAARWDEEDLPALKATEDFLAERVERIVILGPTVEYQGIFPLLLARSYLNGDGRVERYLDPAPRRLDQQMKKMDWAPDTIYVSLFDLLCSDETCARTTSTKEPFHFDHGHFTLEASYEVAAMIDRLGIIGRPGRMSSLSPPSCPGATRDDDRERAVTRAGRPPRARPGTSLAGTRSFRDPWWYIRAADRSGAWPDRPARETMVMGERS